MSSVVNIKKPNVNVDKIKNDIFLKNHYIETIDGKHIVSLDCANNDSKIDSMDMSEQTTNSDTTSIYISSQSIIKSGELKFNDIDLSRLSLIEEDAYNGNFINNYTLNNKYGNYDLSNLTYNVLDNGIIQILSNEDVIAYTDINGVSKIKQELLKTKDDNPEIVNYIINNSDPSKTVKESVDGYINNIKSVEPHSYIYDDEKTRLERIQELFPEIDDPYNFEISEEDAYAKMEVITVNVWDGEKEVEMNLTVNKKLKINYMAAFEELLKIKYPVKLETTGAYNYKRGERLSDHALGGSIDINWDMNPYVTGPNPYENDNCAITEEVVKIMAKYGFTWGGDWKDMQDYMHFSYTGG